MHESGTQRGSYICHSIRVLQVRNYLTGSDCVTGSVPSDILGEFNFRFRGSNKTSILPEVYMELISAS
jgi:hypothetical protein